jgi:hypothetical protein
MEQPITFTVESSLFLNPTYNTAYRVFIGRREACLIHDIACDTYYFVNMDRTRGNVLACLRDDDILGCFFKSSSSDMYGVGIHADVRIFTGWTFDPSISAVDFNTLCGSKSKVGLVTLNTTIRRWISHTPTCTMDTHWVTVKLESICIRPYYAMMALYPHPGTILIRRDHCYFEYERGRDPMMIEMDTASLLTFDDSMFMWLYRYKDFGISAALFEQFYAAWIYAPEQLASMHSIADDCPAAERAQFLKLLKYVDIRPIYKATMDSRNAHLARLGKTKICADALKHVLSYL